MTTQEDVEAKKKPYDPLEAALGPKPKRLDFARAGGGLALAIAGAFLFGWTAGDLAWGLWVSSLCVGYVTVIVALLVEEIPLRREAGRGHNAAFFGGFMLIFTLHFGGFHLLHCLFLDTLLPQDPDAGGFPNVFALFVAAFVGYWPLILSVMIDRAGELWRLKERRGNHDAIFLPYLNVVRLHVMIVVLELLDEWGAGAVGLYVVLAACFFPWGMLIRILVERARKRSERMYREQEEEMKREMEELEKMED